MYVCMYIYIYIYIYVCTNNSEGGSSLKDPHNSVHKGGGAMSKDGYNVTLLYSVGYQIVGNAIALDINTTIGVYSSEWGKKTKRKRQKKKEVKTPLSHSTSTSPKKEKL